MTANQDTKTRAEELRHRRTDQPNPRMTIPAAGQHRGTTNAAPRSQSARVQSVVPPSSGRPVVVRNTTFGTPIHPQAAAQRPRRQYYVALEGTPGAELRLPALPVLRPGWRTLSGLLVVGLLVVIGTLLWSPFFQVEALQIKGMSRIDPSEIQAIADLENISIIEVNAKQIREDLTKAFPDIERVVVSVGLPNLVGITITERQPVLAWQQGDQTRWIDSQGFIFPARGEVPPMLTIVAQDDPPLANPPASVEDAQTADQSASDQVVVPVSATSSEPEKIDPALMGTAQKLVTLVPEGTTLAYSYADGLGWQDPNGTYVYIGSRLGDFDAKYAMYQKIATELSNRGIQPALISVEYLNTPYYRLEQ